MAQIDNRLGDMIRSYREKLGLTQEEMAERLQVNLTHYGNIERAACNPSFSLFLRIAKELNLSVDAYLYSTRDDTAAEITRLLSKCSKEVIFYRQGLYLFSDEQGEQNRENILTLLKNRDECT